MVVNVVGGLVGVLQHGISMGHAAKVILLTIGDGPGTNPALLISRGNHRYASAPIRMLASRW